MTDPFATASWGAQAMKNAYPKWTLEEAEISLQETQHALWDLRAEHRRLKRIFATSCLVLAGTLALMVWRSL